jgi:RimJ/RimL family protein N-acetyltransferase
MVKDYNMEGMKLYNNLFANRLKRGKIKLVPLLSSDARMLQCHVTKTIEDLKPNMAWCEHGFGKDRAKKYAQDSERQWNIKYFDKVNRLVLKIEYMNEFAGCITLREFDDGYTSCSMEYWLREDMRKNKIAVNAVYLCAKAAFAELGIRRIDFIIFPENTASINIMKRIGAIFHGMGCMPSFGRKKVSAFHDRWFCGFYLNKSSLRLSGKITPLALKMQKSLERILNMEK